MRKEKGTFMAPLGRRNPQQGEEGEEAYGRGGVWGVRKKKTPGRGFLRDKGEVWGPCRGP